MKKRPADRAFTSSGLQPADTCVFTAIISFLKIFVPETIARRIVALILLAIHCPVKEVQSMTGMGKSTIYDLRKHLRSCVDEADVQNLLYIKKGAGRKGKTDGSISDAIIRKIETSEFHTAREIKAMIQEMFSISMSVSSVLRFLKKHGFKREWFISRESEFPGPAQLLRQHTPSTDGARQER